MEVCKIFGITNAVKATTVTETGVDEFGKEICSSAITVALSAYLFTVSKSYPSFNNKVMWNGYPYSNQVKEKLFIHGRMRFLSPLTAKFNSQTQMF